MALIYTLTLLIVWGIIALLSQFGNRLIANNKHVNRVGRELSVVYGGSLLFIGFATTSVVTQIYSMSSMVS